MQFYKLVVAIVCVVFVGASMSDAKSTQLTSKEAFAASVGGKTLTNGKANKLVISKNGSITGSIGGKKITDGKWSWRGKSFCRSLRTEAKEYPYACLDVSIDGTAVTFGKLVWKIQ